MSATSKQDFEEWKREQERLWQERHEAGAVNTLGPFSGMIDWRTVPAAMERMNKTENPIVAGFLAWQDAERERLQQASDD